MVKTAKSVILYSEHSRENSTDRWVLYKKKQWVTSQPPIAHFNLNLNYEKFICLFTLQICT